MIQISKRGYHAAAYDIKADRVIIFGGVIDPADYQLSDIWTYDIAANTWAKMSLAESPGMGEGPMAYDSAADRTVITPGILYMCLGMLQPTPKPIKRGRMSTTPIPGLICMPLGRLLGY